jgi:hypothetical protein
MELNEINIRRLQVAELFGLDEKYINELVSSHGLPKEGHNEYNLVKCLKWFVAYKDELHIRECNRIKQEKPQDHLARKSAEKKDLEIQIMQNKLIEADTVRMAISNIFILLSQWLDTMGVRLAPLVIGKTEKKEIQNLINEEAVKIKLEICKMPVELIEGKTDLTQGDND